jgi:HAMP domain
MGIEECAEFRNQMQPRAGEVPTGQYWPAQCFIEVRGRIRYQHSERANTAGTSAGSDYPVPVLVSARNWQTGGCTAAQRVGKGDFSVRLPVSEQDQLGILAPSFNEMAQIGKPCANRKSRSAVLERDIALAHEVQQYLYPRTRPDLSGAGNHDARSYCQRRSLRFPVLQRR